MLGKGHVALGLLLGGLLSAGTLSAPAATAAPLSHHGGGVLLPKHAVAAHYAPTKRTYGARALGVTSVPESVDLRQWAVAPGDQGAEGSCVTWGIGYTMLGWYANRGGEPQTFAPMYLYSQTHVENTPDGGGSYAQDNYALTEQQGIAPQAAYAQGTHNFTDKPTAAERAAASPYKTSRYHELFVSAGERGVGAAAQRTIEQAVADQHPVGIALPIYDGFEYLNAKNYTFSEADATADPNVLGYHYVVVLGYDAQGVWIENSWGSSWGQKGFAKLTWDFVNAEVNEAEYIEGMLRYIPQTDYRGPQLAAPTVSEISATGAKVRWNSLSDPGTTSATYYTASYTDGNGQEVVNADSTTGISLRNLAPSTQYTVTLKAGNTLGLNAVQQATFTTLATTPKVTLGKIKAASARKSIALRWAAAKVNVGKIAQYRVVAKRSGKVVFQHTYSARTLHVTLRHLRAHTTYRVTLSALSVTRQQAARTLTVRTHK